MIFKIFIAAEAPKIPIEASVPGTFMCAPSLVEGDFAPKGSCIATISSMKMTYPVCAPVSGAVSIEKENGEVFLGDVLFKITEQS